MDPNELTADGFTLALRLLKSLGVEFDRAAVFKRLAEVARGETTVFNSPQEEVADMEQELGHPFTPEERAFVLRGFANRAELDSGDRQIAERILEVIRRDLGGV
jgi:hypothetical protein